MLPQCAGYRLDRELEPEHPYSTYSHHVYEGVALASGARVAVKVLTRTFPLRAESQARFVETMRQVEQLRAPSLIPVVGAGFTADTEPFYAMQLVEGEALEAAHGRGRRFAIAEAAPVAHAIAEAASAAHAAGVGISVASRHVMLGRARVQLWDLGVAQWECWAHALVAGTYTNGGHIRWSGELTPDAASGRPSTPRTDAAAMALVVFRMLTGRHYWRHANAFEGFMPLLVEVMGAIEPPQARTDDALPRGFDEWFVACLTGQLADARAAAAALPAA